MGFYEWKKEGKKQATFSFCHARWPAHSRLLDFGMNGIKMVGPFIHVPIITTTPNEITEEVHKRIPAILEEDAYMIYGWTLK